MARHIVWHEADSANELWYRYQSETIRELRLRWHALWLLRQGYTRNAVIQALGINPRTLRDWIGWYQTGGCAEVAHHRSGRRAAYPCRLSVEQQAELAAWAADGLFYTVKEARQWVADTWLVVYSYDGMRTLLDRIGIHPRVPRPLAVQADVAAQEAWKKGGCWTRCVRRRRLTPRG